MKLPDTITPEAHRAIVEVCKIAARRGRELRLARERAERERKENDTPAKPLRGGAGESQKAADRNESDAGGCIDPS